MGRSIGVVNVDLIDEATGKLVAQGSHVKFISPTEPDLSQLIEYPKVTPSLPSPRDSKGAKL